MNPIDPTQPAHTSFTCDRVNCGMPAFCAIGIQIAAIGHAEDPAAAMCMVLGLTVCATHFQTASSEEFLHPKIREYLTASAAHLGRVPPDFARAKLVPIALNSDGFLRVVDTRKEINRRN